MPLVKLLELRINCSLSNIPTFCGRCILKDIRSKNLSYLKERLILCNTTCRIFL